MSRDYWGKQEFPTGWLTRGRIKRGSPPAQNRFRAPNAGISPSISGESSPIVHTAGLGDAIRAGARTYVNGVEENERQAYHAQRLAQITAHQQAQARQAQRKAGIKYAKAKSRVYKRNMATTGSPWGPPTGAPAPAGTVPTPGMVPPTGPAPRHSLTIPYGQPLPPPTPGGAAKNAPGVPAGQPLPNPTGSAPRHSLPIPYGQDLPFPTTRTVAKTKLPIPFGEDLPNPTGPAPKHKMPIPAEYAPPPPPPSAESEPAWGAPDPSFEHGITPAHLIPPAPGTKAWHKQQAALDKQQKSSMPPPPPATSPWGAPTLLTPPPAPTVSQPAKTRSNSRSTKKASATPAVTAPQVVGALTPVENLTQTPPTEATTAPDLTPAPKQRSPRKTTPKAEPKATPADKPARSPRKSASAPAPTAPVAPAGPAPVAKGPVSIQLNPETGKKEPGETHNGQWYPASYLQKHGRPQPK